MRSPLLSQCHRPANVCAFVCALAILLAASCADQSSGETAKPAYEIDRSFKRGPVELSLKVTRKEITIADRIELLLEVKAKEQWDVRLPKFGDKLEQFGITDYQAPQPELLDDGMVRYRRTYELEPFLSGEYKIPPMKITFWKKGNANEHEETPNKVHELETEELTIKVKSLLPDAAENLTIRGIAPPVALPPPPRTWLLASIVLIVALLAGASAFVFWRSRYRHRHGAGLSAKSLLPAHERAFLELEALVADELVDKGETKIFYQRLSGILRRYIENRLALRAPERTTEEFLEDLRTSQALAEEHKRLLEEFLQHCDLVKFAEHQPTNPEIQQAFDACKDFILQTAAERTPVGAAAASAGASP